MVTDNAVLVLCSNEELDKIVFLFHDCLFLIVYILLKIFYIFEPLLLCIVIE